MRYATELKINYIDRKLIFRVRGSTNMHMSTIMNALNRRNWVEGFTFVVALDKILMRSDTYSIPPVECKLKKAPDGVIVEVDLK